MVVFTCGHCGESVQKPKVEKHYLTKCRNFNPNLSCMDCFKDFLGNDYQNHTKCITEEQRYSGKGFVAKEKKGEKKQNAWVEMLQSVLDEQKNASGNVLRIIETISKHNNTPRKKPKFINFVKNVCGAKTNLKDIDQAWDLISVKLSELSNNQNKKKDQEDDIPETNGNADEDKNDGNDKEEKQNGVKIENGDTEEKKETAAVEILNDDKKKMSKKQRKEEKKRKKYEAELQSAAVPPTEVQDENVENVQVIKKDKKKKNKDAVNNGEIQGREKDGKNKNKKRKRLDTVNSTHETNNHNISNENNENIENEPVNKEKNQKKKLKIEENDEIDESICLHDQNVAKSEEITEKNGKFNWHSVIISVLEKKGNELPFKRLQKKVLTAYTEETEQEVDDRIADKFIKKLKSAPNVKVDKNRVLLIQ